MRDAVAVRARKENRTCWPARPRASGVARPAAEAFDRRPATHTPSRVPAYDLLPIPDGFTSASGVLSVATGATAELGERAMAEIVRHVRGLIQEALFDSFPR